jgi:hypothetical protein
MAAHTDLKAMGIKSSSAKGHPPFPGFTVMGQWIKYSVFQLKIPAQICHLQHYLLELVDFLQRAVVFAISVPSRLLLATYVCFAMLMRKLLPMHAPPPLLPEFGMASNEEK